VIAERSNFYERWRSMHGSPAALRESADGTPPERLVQAIWSRQRLRRDQLLASDGRTVQILHPGFWNREAGPDFRGSVVQFAGEPPAVGDIEVDLRSDGWRAHGHDRNPAFANVVLHVVWDQPSRTPTKLPTLAIRDRLDAPLAELHSLLEGELPPPLNEEQQGLCRAPLQALAGPQLQTLLCEAARVRLEARASQLRARARQVGWELALVEGLLRALGYKHNSWPMQRLGELSPRLREVLAGSDRAATPLHWQALLLGTSGLLPAEVKRATGGTDDYLRRVWDIWWRERDPLASQVLPPKLWRLAGIRPANHPQRRLALAAHWLADEEFFKRLETWFAKLARLHTDESSSFKPAEITASLLAALDPGEDKFWSRHWTLRAKPMPAAQPLLGPTRLTDLAVNVILPWFFVRAREGRNAPWSALAQRLWFAWPAAEDNSVLRLARERLLGRTRRNALKTAADQQGLLQIVRDFCDHSNAICDQCRFPELVSQWSGGTTSPTPFTSVGRRPKNPSDNA
jgi:hypothetical protein